MYDYGSSASLYNIQKKISSPLIICEGELDCLLLNSLNISAVSSTGGAKTFKKEWADILNGYSVFICLDNDHAGMMGAIRIQSYIPTAKWIPLPVGMGKDVTEFIQSNGVKKFVDLMQSSIPYTIPELPSRISTDPKEIRELIGKFKIALNEIVFLQRTDGREHLEEIRVYLYSQYNTLTQRLGAVKLVSKYSKDKVDLAAIKQIPITRYLAFNNSGFTKCLWHNDTNASLYYNNFDSKYPNTCHCFSCNHTYDVISVYMRINNVDFKLAIKRLIDEA